ncbi:SDR family oxidoreductase [Parvularcula sp. LCG005]|uniref:SDR family oxidoreductase n=1 Tax=Parvularcula sp. LCG005 TaxID=3078805 RepID=UPI002941E72E|nr:SDR family oxidoreductase [Parvularcula sp. LCG005]WOI54589.1 SDR family oxidoreductase [Parvularcula sp. LCG005]
MTYPIQYDMKGQSCFMSGATSGINEQIARRFAEAGANIFVISRSPEKVQRTVDMLKEAGGEASGSPVDVRDYDSVVSAVTRAQATFGNFDVVFAGQAGNFPAGAAQMSANAFKSVIDIDLLGTFNVFRATIEHAKKPGASYLAISAPQATRPWLFQSHVCAAKAGVNMLIKCCALEWGASGVRVNAISPGPIDGTEGMERLAPTEELKAKVADAVAMKRMGNRDDIAEAALWLCSPAASYVTGTVLEAEGGMTLGDATNAMKL